MSVVSHQDVLRCLIFPRGSFYVPTSTSSIFMSNIDQYCPIILIMLGLDFFFAQVLYSSWPESGYEEQPGATPEPPGSSS